MDFINFEDISLVNKEDYSNCCNCFKVKVITSNLKYCSSGNLKPKFSYITQIKINEISKFIANDSKVKQWINHISEWNSTLSQAITNAKTFSPELLYNWKRQEKETIKSYIRDWAYVSNLIENDWKLEELNKNVQGLKADFETIKKQVNELEQKVNNLDKRVTNLENTSNWNCANIGGIVATASAPVPVIGTVTSVLSGLVAGSCAIAGV